MKLSSDPIHVLWLAGWHTYVHTHTYTVTHIHTYIQTHTCTVSHTELCTVSHRVSDARAHTLACTLTAGP